MEKKGKTQRPPKKPEKKERTGKLHASIAFSKGKKSLFLFPIFLIIRQKEWDTETRGAGKGRNKEQPTKTQKPEKQMSSEK